MLTSERSLRNLVVDADDDDDDPAENEDGDVKELAVTLNSRPRMAVSRPSSWRNGGYGRRNRGLACKHGD